jgi:adenine-specific DNA glycosylase
MAGFWELPAPGELPAARAGKIHGEFRHTITHHHYTFTVRSATVRIPKRDFRWFSAAELLEIPLSTTARKALKLAKFF